MKKYTLYLCFAILMIIFIVPPVSAAGGSGTAGDPYIIETPAELQAISSDLSAYYALGNDIDLTGITWTPIGSTSTPFIGHFNGQNYTISNLYINTPSTSYVGLFGVFGPGASGQYTQMNNINISASSNVGSFVGAVIMSTGTTIDAYLTKIEVDNSYVYGSGNQVGGIAGYVYNYANISFADCNASNSKVQSGGYNCGGIAGYAAYTNSNADFANCYVINCTVQSGGYNCGGIAGSAAITNSNADFANCYVINCTVQSGGHNCGGLAGFAAYTNSNADFANCYVINCALSAVTERCGGIAGFAAATNSNADFANCYVTDCTIYAPTYSGGVFGRHYLPSTYTVDDCTIERNTIISTGYSAGIGVVK